MVPLMVQCTSKSSMTKEKCLLFTLFTLPVLSPLADAASVHKGLLGRIFRISCTFLTANLTHLLLDLTLIREITGSFYLEIKSSFKNILLKNLII